MVHPGAIHPLTPGTTAYAVLKLSAVGGLVGLKMLLSRRGNRSDQADDLEPESVADPPLPPHPVSRRKARRRKRRR